MDDFPNLREFWTAVSKQIQYIDDMNQLNDEFNEDLKGLIDEKDSK